MSIQQPKIGGDFSDLVNAGERRSFVVLLPDAYTLEAVIGLGGMSMPMTIGGLTAQAGKCVGVLAEVVLLNSVDVTTITQPSPGNMSAVGTQSLVVPLEQGEVLTITAVVGGQTVSLSVTGCAPKAPAKGKTYTTAVRFTATLSDDADEGSVT